MSMYCERCQQTSYGTTIECQFCKRRTLHERLDDIGIWLNYGTSYWRYPAWWALLILGAFCGVNAFIIFAMTIRWLWGF